MSGWHRLNSICPNCSENDLHQISLREYKKTHLGTESVPDSKTQCFSCGALC